MGALLAFAILSPTFASCSWTSCSDCGGFSGSRQPPVVRRWFDPTIATPQITTIYFDHDSNGVLMNDTDEWLIIDSRDTLNIHGWTLSAGR